MNKLQRMKATASGMVLLMAVLFCISQVYMSSWTGFVWVLAFSEAALVGALADWFAVTALFKYPLGIPIPHTAIIPRNRHRLATALSTFVGEYLLSPEWLIAQIKEKKLILKALDWVSYEENIQIIGKKLRENTQLTQTMSVSEHTNKSIRESLKSVSWSQPLSVMMTQISETRSYQEPVSSLLASLSKGLITQKSWANREVQQEAPLNKLPLLGKVSRTIASRFSDKAVDKLSRYLEEAANDPEHSFYSQFDSYLLKLSQDLEKGTYDPNLKQLKESMLNTSEDSQVASDFIKSISDEIDYTAIISIYLSDNAKRLLASPERLEAFTEKVLLQIYPLLSATSPKLTKTMNQAVLRFDEKTLSQTIEEKIGADLQFIRINGTLVGGLIGLILHLLKITILK